MAGFDLGNSRRKGVRKDTIGLRTSLCHVATTQPMSVERELPRSRRALLFSFF